MKAFIKMLVLSIFVLVFSAVSHADEKGMMCPITGKMMGKGSKGDCKMCAMMMGKCMTSHSIVATTDGGIVVSSCGKLAKYDKNLNLIKEVERIDQKECMAKMAEMKEKCPMCAMMKGKMGKADESEETMSETPAAEAQPVNPAPSSTDATDHSAHH